MSAFSSSNFSTKDYSNYRPTYPVDFLCYLLSYHTSLPQNTTNKLIDIGTGPGEGSLPLIPNFNEIIMTDASSVMIDEARQNVNEALLSLKNPPKIEFYVCPGESISSKVESNTADMIISAECVHWLDFPKWLNECWKTLKPEGTLSYFGYVDPVFIEVGETPNNCAEQLKLANKIYEDFVYERKEGLGKYWQQPGRGKLRSMYKELNEILLNDNRWGNIACTYRVPSIDSKIFNAVGDGKEKWGNDCFILEKKMTVANFLKYVDTWSSSHRWNQSHGVGEKAGELFLKELNQKIGWNDKTTIKVGFKTFYTLARKLK